jgi:hypothetical protein
MGWDTASKSYQPVPAPAIGGPEVFKYVDPIIVEWLAFTLRTTYLNLVSDDQKKASNGTGSNPSDDALESSVPAKKSRKSQTV